MHLFKHSFCWYHYSSKQEDKKSQIPLISQLDWPHGLWNAFTFTSHREKTSLSFNYCFLEHPKTILIKSNNLTQEDPGLIPSRSPSQQAKRGSPPAALRTNPAVGWGASSPPVHQPINAVLLTARSRAVRALCPIPTWQRGLSFTGCTHRCATAQKTGLQQRAAVSLHPTFSSFIENSRPCKFSYFAVNVKRISFDASKNYFQI